MKFSSNTIEHEEPSSIYLSRPNAKVNESKEVQSINFATPRSKDQAQLRDKKRADCIKPNCSLGNYNNGLRP